MYFIMNKERIIAEFEYIKNGLGTAVPKLVSGSLPEIYGDMKLKSWLETRRMAKRRPEIARLLRNLGMTNLKSFIDVSLGLTLTDKLWVKEEHALTCNYDRHLNNIQFLVDSDTYDIIGLAPVFDNGMGLCSHCKEENAQAFIEYGNDHVPFAYYSFDDHIPQLMSEDMYNKIGDIREFCFVNHKNYPVSDERLTALNGFIQHRINRLLALYKE